MTSLIFVAYMIKTKGREFEIAIQGVFKKALNVYFESPRVLPRIFVS